MSSSGSDAVTIGSRCGPSQPAQPARPAPSFCAGGWWSQDGTGEMMKSEVARPWLRQWSPKEQRWRHMTGLDKQDTQEAQQAQHQHQRNAWPPATFPAAAVRPAGRPTPAAPRPPPPAPAAAQPTQPTVTLELAAGSCIDVRTLPQGSAVSLEATAQGSLLLELTLPPGGKLRLGLGAATATQAVGAASAAVLQPPPAVAAAPVLKFSPPAAAVPQPAAATEHSQAFGGESTHSSPVRNPAPDSVWAAMAATTGAVTATTVAQRAAEPAPASEAGDDADAASQLAALSLALQDVHWDKPELPPAWHLTVHQGDCPLRSVRLDTSAAEQLRLSKARLTVLLKGTATHERLAVRLRRRQWRLAVRLLSRAVAETVSGVRLWSQHGSGLLSASLLPGAAAALAAAQRSATAGVAAAAASGAEAADEPSPQAATSPAELLHDLRAAAPAECLTAQPPASKNDGASPAAPRPGQPSGGPASLARLFELQREASMEVAAGTADA